MINIKCFSMTMYYRHLINAWAFNFENGGWIEQVENDTLCKQSAFTTKLTLPIYWYCDTIFNNRKWYHKVMHDCMRTTNTNRWNSQTQ
jgi:hypothetical protein